MVDDALRGAPVPRHGRIGAARQALAARDFTVAPASRHDTRQQKTTHYNIL
jgi:hypothetical protein